MNMHLVLEALKQLRRLWLLLTAIYGAVLLLFAAAAWASITVGPITIYQLVGDVTDIADLPFYVGAISQLGMLIWSAGATTCWLGYFYLGRWPDARPEARRLLLWAGLFTTLLLLDDVYLLHDEVFPKYLRIAEELVLLAYLAIGALMIWLNRAEIMRGEYALFALALGVFGVSLLFDAIPSDLYAGDKVLESLEKVVEDGAKLAGIATWCAFYVRYVFEEFKALASGARSP